MSDNQPQVGTLCAKNMGNDLLIIPCDLPKGHDGPCERNIWPVNSPVPQPTPAEPRIGHFQVGNCIHGSSLFELCKRCKPDQVAAEPRIETVQTQSRSEPLTYEQEVHALLCSAASSLGDLLRYFEAQAATEKGDHKKLTLKCIEWKREDLQRIRNLIPQALERRDMVRAGAQPEPAMEMFSSADHAKWYRRGFTEGSQAGLKIAQDVMSRRLPDPIIIQRVSPPSSPGAARPSKCPTCARGWDAFFSDGTPACYDSWHGSPGAPQTDELVIEIARELYDRFVMGGWEPQNAYPTIREWLVRVARR